MRPITRTVAPIPPARRVDGELGAHGARDARGAYGERAGDRPSPGRTIGGGTMPGARGEVNVAVRVFDHGGSAVVARGADGRFDALVR